MAPRAVTTCDLSQGARRFSALGGGGERLCRLAGSDAAATRSARNAWRTHGAAIINLNNAALPNQAAHRVIARAAYISATSPSPLVEATLDGATVTVALDGISFLNSATTSSFMPVTTVPNLTITNAGSISAGDTSATLTLAHSGNFDADATLAVSVAASAHSGTTTLATNAVAVLPDTPTASIQSTSPAALTEANLHQARVTVALANAVTVTAASDADGLDAAAIISHSRSGSARDSRRRATWRSTAHFGLPITSAA